jgi:16S rRNA (uracil1498-N3)-methyltransferase
MSRRRFYVPKESIREGYAVLPSRQAHHLRNVLRLGTGDAVEIFDGEGAGYAGEIELHGSEVFVRSLKKIDPGESPVRLILAPALIKAAKFELVLQKATELGVSGIVPLNTRFSDIRIPSEKIDSRMERWRRIVQEASKQCRRFAAPRIWEPLDFSEFLALEEFSSYRKLLLYEKAVEPWQAQGELSDEVVLCIGPEGGWEPGEVERAERAGFGIFSLGPWILRAETAAIAAVSILQHHLQQKN